MKKQLLIIGIIVLLVCVGLSGCNNQQSSNVTGDTGILQIVNYSIETMKWNSATWQNEKKGDGFIHDGDYYKISGTVKNIAGRMIDTATITVNFYDSGKNFLGKQTAHISNLANTYTTTFEVTYYKQNYYAPSYFENVTQIDFKITEGYTI